MRYTVLFCLLILNSCTGEKSNSSVSVLIQDKLDQEFAGKIFTIGPEIDSLKLTTFGYCDCCTGDISFQDDLTFILANYCEGSEDYFFGSYILGESVLKLFYHENVFSLKYNWDQEVNENATEYFLSNSKLENINSMELHVSYYKNKPILTFDNGTSYALEANKENGNEFAEKLAELKVYSELKKEDNDLENTIWIRKILPTNDIDTISFLNDSSAEIYLAEIGWTFDATYYFNSDTLVTEIISQQFDMNDVSELEPDLISYYILENGELEIVKHAVIRPNGSFSNVDQDLDYFRNFKRIK